MKTTTSKFLEPVPRSGSDSAIAAIAQDRRRLTAWSFVLTIFMRITFHCLFALSACILLASCSTVGELKGATSRFEELKEAGQLPGIAATDHGKLQSQAFPITHEVAYPASVEICATKENDQSRYTYTFTKDSASSEWRLTAAWRTSPDGNRENLTSK